MICIFANYEAIYAFFTWRRQFPHMGEKEQKEKTCD